MANKHVLTAAEEPTATVPPMSFAGLIDQWGEHAGADVAKVGRPVAFAITGELVLIFAASTPVLSTMELAMLAAKLRVRLPETIDGIRLRRITWRRVRATAGAR